VINTPTKSYDYKLFTNHEGKTLTAFLSDLGVRANDPAYTTWMENRIYDDAADCGIAIKGKADTTWWYLVEDSELNDPEYSLGVSGWRFKPIDEHARKYPVIAGMTVLVFND
jgi:hypothetical protein